MEVMRAVMLLEAKMKRGINGKRTALKKQKKRDEDAAKKTKRRKGGGGKGVGKQEGRRKGELVHVVDDSEDSGEEEWVEDGIEEEDRESEEEDHEEEEEDPEEEGEGAIEATNTKGAKTETLETQAAQLTEPRREMYEAACKFAYCLANEVLPLLEAYCQTDDAEYVHTSLQPWNRSFDVTAILSEAVFLGVNILEKQKDYAGACDVLKRLLRCNRITKCITNCNEKCHGEGSKGGGEGSRGDTSDKSVSKDPHTDKDTSSNSGGGAQGQELDEGDSSIVGKCYRRLLIDLKHQLDDCDRKDELNSERRKYLALARSGLRRCSAAHWGVLSTTAGLDGGLKSWSAPPPSDTIGQKVVGRIGKKGSRLLYKGSDGGVQLVENLVKEVKATDAKGGWNSYHDEGSYLRALFGLLLHEQIFADDVPDVFFAPYQNAPLDLRSPQFYKNRKGGIDRRLAQLAGSSATVLAELVRASYEKHYAKCSRFIQWCEGDVARRGQLFHLQKIAVCFKGRALAGILLHMACTGMFAGMPDLTSIRAVKPDAEQVTGGRRKWSGVECGLSDKVQVRFSTIKLPECQAGLSVLEVGQALELRYEDNPRGLMGVQGRPDTGTSIVVYLTQPHGNYKCGYVANKDVWRVKPGAAIAIRRDSEGRSPQWMEAAERTDSYTIDIGDDWKLEGRLAEVKSKNDALWTEQRVWLRSLLDVDFLDYENPYLFYGDGDAQMNKWFSIDSVRSNVVDISTIRVDDP
jgi:hypothetical protein